MNINKRRNTFFWVKVFFFPLSSIARTRQSWKTQAQIANVVCSADDKYKM